MLTEHGITISPSTYYAHSAAPSTEAELADAYAAHEISGLFHDQPKTFRGEPGSRLLLHLPPGDGWRRVAWVRQDFERYSMSSLLCEYSLQHVVKVGGATIRLRGDADGAYRPATAYLPTLSFQHHHPEATPHALREMVDASLGGT